jgi:hypothetical protein
LLLVCLAVRPSSTDFLLLVPAAELPEALVPFALGFELPAAVSPAEFSPWEAEPGLG